MRSDHTEESRFERFLHWAEGEEADQGSEEAEDPERAEFVEYLEYIDSHEPMDFGAYRLMRMRERAAKGIPQPAVPGHHAVVEQRWALSSILRPPGCATLTAECGDVPGALRPA